MKIASLIICFFLVLQTSVMAADYAGQISAYRRAQGLSSVTSDSRLNAVALQQARAMASSGTISHTVGGSFSSRVAGLRKSRTAENIAAGFRSFGEMLKQWEDSPRPSGEFADGGCEEGRRCVGRESELSLSRVLGDGDHRLSASVRSRADKLHHHFASVWPRAVLDQINALPRPQRHCAVDNWNLKAA